ncbi:hypothetical protein [Acaryochloris marina]|uniref:hypothetical protein n=1 Tax=Acaryochloris marina TaxID=155978 RepID=UPI0011D12F64|nr:hypothetical protein [Acaryochloris marina]
MAHHCHVRRQISIPNERLRDIATEAEFIKTAKEYEQLDHPPHETSPTTVASVVREELKRCKSPRYRGNTPSLPWEGPACRIC